MQRPPVSPFLLFTLGMLCLATGCASTVTVLCHSDPRCATIYSAAGRNFGRTPVRLVYTLSREQRGQDTVHVGRIIARWVSGASDTANLFIPLKPWTPWQEHTFLRPAGAPNLDIDVGYARELETKRITVDGRIHTP